MKIGLKENINRQRPRTLRIHRIRSSWNNWDKMCTDKAGVDGRNRIRA